MKKNSATIIAVVAMLLAFISYRRTIVLNQQMNNLQNNLNYGISNLNNEIQDIYSNVDEKLEEMASIISSEAWEYGEIDFSKDEVQIIYRITPKEYIAGNTTAVLIVGTQEHKMEFLNNSYQAVFELPLGDDVIVNSVEFHDEGKVRTQHLEKTITPRYDILLNIHAQYIGSVNSKKGKSEIESVYKGTVNIKADVAEKLVNNEIITVDIVAKLDGKEINRLPVALGVEGQDEYLSQAATGNSRRSRPEPVQSSKNNIFYYLNHSWTIPNGSTLELWVDTVDRYGYRYSAKVDRIELDENGTVVEVIDSQIFMEFGSMIYNSKGDVIFDAKKWMDANKPLYEQ